ncbi:hypothetical protein DH2020_003347 [Rehmannia glutinosa]|uniref:Protein PHYTOCHROME KINASE SUBSTRATE 1-like n=1 Tax=Rehmannia glutinosa TaxID=99300 RepID=A0ABR0XLD0_REHGL
MPVITLTSPSTTNTSHPPEISTSTRDASFSSYLDGAEENFILKLASETTKALNSSISTPHDHIFLGKNKTDDREIDVFDAQKYFNEETHSPTKVVTKNLPTHHQKKDDHHPLEIFAIKEKPSKPKLSIRSESSWNSRSALLHTVNPKNQQTRKAIKKSFLASITCNCSCMDKNSVEIDDYTPEKSKQGGDHSVIRKPDEGHFSFPVFNSKSGNQAVKVQLPEINDPVKRKSLEVFGSPILENVKNCSALEKKLTLMTWDAISPEEIKIPSISSEIMQNDSDSDASSDLFEIESLSKGNPFLSRQTSLSGPTTCYAPSEASIEWSVVTASAADFSVLSDSEDSPCPKKEGSVNSKIPKLRSGILSGCKSEKAVRIAGDAYRGNNVRAESLHDFRMRVRWRVLMQEIDSDRSMRAFCLNRDLEMLRISCILSEFCCVDVFHVVCFFVCSSYMSEYICVSGMN